MLKLGRGILATVEHGDHHGHEVGDMVLKGERPILADDEEFLALLPNTRLAINPNIYAELSLTFSTVEALDKTIADLGLAMLELPRPALFLADKALVRYQRSCRRRRASIADARHAAVRELLPEHRADRASDGAMNPQTRDGQRLIFTNRQDRFPLAP